MRPPLIRFKKKIKEEFVEIGHTTTVFIKTVVGCSNRTTVFIKTVVVGALLLFIFTHDYKKNLCTFTHDYKK